MPLASHCGGGRTGGFIGHQPSFRFGEKSCLKGIRQSAREQQVSTYLYVVYLHINMHILTPHTLLFVFKDSFSV